MKIKNILGREVIDSRGNPTVEAEVILEDGSRGRAIVPSGASTGTHEAVELRDSDKSRFNGLGVLNAVKNIKDKIAPILIGKDAQDQNEVDKLMIDLDGTENKGKLGANAILSVSMAISQAEANSQDKWLFEYLSKFNPDFDGTYLMPVPMMNVMNGGKHAPEGVDMQEFMVMPHGSNSFSESLRKGIETFHSIKKILHAKGFITLVGDEGGFAPALKKNAQAIEIILEGIEKAGYKAGIDSSIAMDPAMSELFVNDHYELKTDGVTYSEDEMIDYWEDLLNKYPIVSMEDILDQDQWAGWAKATSRFGNRVQIVGDDFLVTNTNRLQKAIDQKSCNSILVKVNQIGTVTEAINAINLAKQNGFSAIVSHRSGEAEDTFIADLVVAMGTGQIKTGSGSRSERIAKYNQLLRIEEYLGDKAEFVNPFGK